MIAIINFDSRDLQRHDIKLFMAAVDYLCAGLDFEQVVLKLQAMLYEEIIENDLYVSVDKDRLLDGRLRNLRDVLYPLIKDRVISNGHVICGHQSIGEDTFIIIQELE